MRRNEGWTIKLLLAIDALTSSENIVAAVVSRPWPSNTFAHALTAIEYAAVPEKIWQDADGQFEPVKRLKILIGIDGSAFSLSAARSVAARPWPSGTIVKLLSVEEPTIHLAERVIDELETATRSMPEAATQAEAILSYAGLSTTSDIVKGNPKEQIIRHAAEWSADLVVVGSHGRRGVKRWLLGSVSEAVARHAYCSVEVIRTHRAS